MLSEAALERHPGRSAVAVGLAEDADAPDWESFVSASPWAGYHAWGWRRVFGRALVHRCLCLVAHGTHGVEAVLPLAQINSPLFGRTLASLPFLNYGGVVARSDAAGQALVHAAAHLARRNR